MGIRIILIGGGYFGRIQARAWLRLPDVDLVGIVESSSDIRKILQTGFPKVKIVANLESLIDLGNIDIVDVATPPSTHADIISPLLNIIPNIICQKPFCADYETAQFLVEKSEASSTKLIVHENFRFMPWYRKIKSIISQGDLGEIRQACFRMRPGDGNGESAYLARQPYFRKMERFLIHETGIHWIDVFRYLFGEPKSIFAELWQSNQTIVGEDSGYLILNMKNGIRTMLDANRTLDHNAKNHRLVMGEFTVEGSKASLFLNGDGTIIIRTFGSNEQTSVFYEFTDNDFGGDCVFHFQQHVINHLKNKNHLECLARDYLQNMSIEEAAYNSANIGQKITFS